MLLEADSAAVTGYNDSYADLLHYNSGTGRYEYLADDRGQLKHYEYYYRRGARRYLKRRKIQHGQTGTLIKLQELTYTARTSGKTTIHVPREDTVFRSEAGGGSQPVTTEYRYEWYGGGLQMKHLPTTGGGPAMTAVLGNHAQMWVSPTGVAAPHIQAGKVRALATLGATRHPRFPDVPTLKELSYDIEYYFWVGLFAPVKVPAAVLRTLDEAVRQAVRDPEFTKAMDKVQTEVAYLGGDEFARFWQRDARTVAAVIKQIGKVEKP